MPSAEGCCAKSVSLYAAPKIYYKLSKDHALVGMSDVAASDAYATSMKQMERVPEGAYADMPNWLEH